MMATPDGTRWAVLCAGGAIHVQQGRLLIGDFWDMATTDCELLNATALHPCGPHSVEALADGWTR